MRGKSTTTQLLSDRLGIPPGFEPVDEHPFLEAFYRDTELHALKLELTFLLLHSFAVEQFDAAGWTVADFSPYKDLVFSRINLTGEDLRLVEQTYDHVWRGDELPEVVVFLDVPVQVCFERMRRRGRAYEQGVPISYLRRLRDSYLASLRQLGRKVVRLELAGVESPDLVADRVLAATAEHGFPHPQVAHPSGPLG